MKRVIAAVLVAALIAPALAQEPSLGRLFLTPEQRAALDNARRNRIRAEALAATAAKKPRIPPARTVTINGIVSRSDGESTIWINGHPTEGQTEDGMRVTISSDSQSSVVVREPEKGKRLHLKVGQSADLISGRIQEPYEPRRVPVTPLPSSEPGSAGALPDVRGGKASGGGKSLRASREDSEPQDGQDRESPSGSEEKASEQ